MLRGTQKSSAPLLITALALALLVGFIVPRPTFVETLWGARQSDFADPYTTATAQGTSVNGRLQVDLYGETLCPDTQHIILDVLAPMFDNGLSEYIDLTYYSYGKAKPAADSASGGINCQHGPTECKYNRYMNCAQDLTKGNQDRWFPYVKCMAEEMRSMDAAAEKCATDAGLNAVDLAECAEGERGSKLEREAGEQTTALQPQLTFVPWVSGRSAYACKRAAKLWQNQCPALFV